ncbi:NAD(P)/FAD-dependent oxidoreductase [Occultella glacieicola]|uniref:NAD(P)/FAD-dependent oxidoreductase n=1 Tax=Occultella glacieicola TaxID=2518684 RepID=A0ABY2DZ49_9MICO|nr:NAD(P)/FAD-dependent oxidoreductase [Occultella glacieicola]TDE89955.1 NAD(P)/FAD-dependent oxidoreductase [Occultella glacieicola]
MATRVAIVGGGHNALVAAAYLAREGHDVTVLERLDHVGGAAVSGRPFPGVDARLSRFSYLVSLLPPALATDLGLDLDLRSRPTASYTPYDGPDGAGGLLVETRPGPATAASFRARTGSDAEYDAWQEFYAGADDLAEALAPTLLEPLPTAEHARALIGPAWWADLTQAPIGSALERTFTDDLVRGVVGTDALIGTFASLHSPSLRQNRCWLYHVIGGEWRVPVGGMGAVTAELERVARAAGVRIVTGASVRSVEAGDGGARLISGAGVLEVDWVLGAVAPYTLAGLLGDDPGGRPQGAQVKINLVLSRLPRLRSGIDPRVAFAGTLHLAESMTELESAQAAMSADPRAAVEQDGTPCPGEIYCHTLTDPSILGTDLAASGAHTLTYFGLHQLEEGLADEALRERAWRRFLASIEPHLAEPLEPLLLRDATGAACVEVRSPGQIEEELGMPGGNIFHGDLSWPWLESGRPGVPGSPAHRWGVATEHPRVLIAGSGAVRGGAVSGIGGHNAAHALLEML